MKRKSILLGCILCLTLFTTAATPQDKIEFLSGISMPGKVVKITDEVIVVKIGSREREFPLDKIYAVTQDGKRRVINEKGESPAPPKRDKVEAKEEKAKEEPKKTIAKRPGKKPKKRKKVSPRNIEKRIKKAEKNKPDWWDDVKLEVPDTLDLTAWRAPSGMDAKEAAEKFPSSYIWSKVIPNPDLWKMGVKLAHQCLKKSESNASQKTRIMAELAGYYKNLLNDYARAAHYYRQLPAGSFGVDVGLGDCYFEMGNADMAAELYKKHEKTVGRDADIVRRYTKMGEIKQALKVGAAMVKSSDGRDKAISLLACGDAARADGDYKKAIEYYEKVKDVDVPDRGDAKKTKDERSRVDRMKHRAKVAARMVKLREALDLSKIPDGTYSGKARGYGGDIEVEVVIKGGAIEKVNVTSHKETRFYTAMQSIPAQIVQNQGLKVDAVTSATVSSDAIVAAVGAALEEAMK
ncbi:MAG: FMN-binding protein [Planctomycetes bacterium]|nr:FMN-binding protein [Planctomycetota bacterium]